MTRTVGVPAWVLWAAVAVLLLGGAAYQFRGYRLLFANGGVDLYQRWLEQQYVMNGQNPFDLTYHRFGLGQRPWRERDVSEIPGIGVPDSGGYPPWAFVSGWAVFWPRWSATVWLFAGLNAVATAAIGVWAYRLGAAGAGRAAWCLLAASTVAVAAHCTTLQVGQCTTVVVALLCGAAALCGGPPRHQWLGGLLLGIALLKPTIAGPFALAVLLAGHFRAVAAAGAYLALGSLAIWWQTGTSPVEMLLQMTAAGAGFSQDGRGLINLLLATGLNPKLATPVLAAAVLVPTTALMWAYRRRPLLDLFAVAAVAGRLWTYHRDYDNLMLVFVLVALGRRALQVPGDRFAAGAFALVGVTLWVPASLTTSAGFAALQLVTWVGGLVILLRPAADPAPAAPAAGSLLPCH